MPDVLMPRLSDTMTDGILTQWLKHEGDTVQRGDVLAEIETDKATMELEAHDSGVLTRIIAGPGSTVPIGQPIAVIGDEDAAAAPGDAAAEVPVAATQSMMAPDGAVSIERSPVRTSPLARALARQHGLDIAGIAGTGPGGRVVRADVQAAIAAQSRHPAGQVSVSAAPAQAVTAQAATADREPQGDRQIPLTSIRRISAQRLTESAAAPHFYLTSVVDAEPLLALRSQLNELPDAQSKVSVTDLLIRACAVALRDHPAVNSSWGGDHLIRRARINVGVAVALDDSLIVPVIRDADRKRLSEIAAEAHALAERARAGKLTPDEFSHGTFTVSNLGMFGIDHFTAVINPPEAAILAVGAAREQAVVRNGQLVVGTTMKLTLSIDHRVLDGATAAAFLRDLVRLVEQPLQILM
ncbi:MAG TPA: dihydrolipoamide acetyltransferase family protein [Mycobacteriales bacterium]|nr:dihydrolipoamide acetyltransferase family protein [Mycobacteriales bacterium]